jgi:hypothetical protein
MRRVFSYLVDLAFLGAPWSALLGMSALPERGNWIGGLAVFAMLTILGSAGTIMMLVVQTVLFLRRGRTLGMAVTGLAVAKGRRWLALLLAPLTLAMPLLVQLQILAVLRNADVLGEDAVGVLQALACLVAPAINLVFLVGSRRRTLSDLVSGLHVVRAPAVSELPTSLRRGLNRVDWLAAIGVGVPIVLGLGHPPILGAALGGLVALLALGALELGLWKHTGTTLGMRALAQEPLPRTPS